MIMRKQGAGACRDGRICNRPGKRRVVLALRGRSLDLHFPAAVHGGAPVKKQWSAPVVVWCVLCGLTLLSVALVEGGWGRSVPSIIIVFIATMKSQVVI